MPPIVASAPGSTGKNRPVARSSVLSCTRVTPACTLQLKFSGSTCYCANHEHSCQTRGRDRCPPISQPKTHTQDLVHRAHIDRHAALFCRNLPLNRRSRTERDNGGGSRGADLDHLRDLLRRLDERDSVRSHRCVIRLITSMLLQSRPVTGTGYISGNLPLRDIPVVDAWSNVPPGRLGQSRGDRRAASGAQPASPSGGRGGRSTHRAVTAGGRADARGGGAT
jgi:hypothetical protein